MAKTITDTTCIKALAYKIDNRLGPISGRDADAIAVALRWAAERIDGITHPTGSQLFAATLERLNVPAPWRLDDEEVGAVLAANGACAFSTSGPHYGDEATRLAAWIVCAVNTCAGFRAKTA